ncbi:MAG: hypothetical protein R3D80_22030 [Paracoccaceae bacterium]
MEISSRTLLGRYALAPKPELVQECHGILAEACDRWRGVKLHMGVMPSNHFHYMATCPSANEFGRWMSFVKAAIARAAQFHHDIRGPIWDRRFRAIPILDDAALRERVRYFMAQMCNPACDLVIGPRHWPGMNCVDALCRGVKIRGTYVRSAERRRLAARKEKLPLNRTLELTPLPGLPEDEEQRKTWFRQIEQEIVAETRERQAANGIVCKPPKVFETDDGHFVPDKMKKSPAPHSHCSCAERRAAFMAALHQFVDLWRGALELMKRGARACFPEGGWWPYDCHLCRPQRE